MDHRSGVSRVEPELGIIESYSAHQMPAVALVPRPAAERDQDRFLVFRVALFVSNFQFVSLVSLNTTRNSPLSS